jgi:hypothetical protein
LPKTLKELDGKIIFGRKCRFLLNNVKTLDLDVKMGHDICNNSVLEAVVKFHGVLPERHRPEIGSAIARFIVFTCIAMVALGAYYLRTRRRDATFQAFQNGRA